MQQQSSELEEKVAICAAAIGARAVIEATYNELPAQLHPHQLIERNGAIYLRAVNPAKARRADEAAALGLFHLAGLSGLKIVGRAFQPLPPASLAPARQSDRILETI